MPSPRCANCVISCSAVTAADPDQSSGCEPEYAQSRTVIVRSATLCTALAIESSATVASSGGTDRMPGT